MAGSASQAANPRTSNGRSQRGKERVATAPGSALLRRADFLLDRAGVLPVGRPDDGPHGDPRPLHFALYHNADINISEEHQPAPSQAIGLHRLIRVDGAREAVDEEGRQRERCPGPGAVRPDGAARLGDVHLEEAVHDVLAALEFQPVGIQCWSVGKGTTRPASPCVSACSRRQRQTRRPRPRRPLVRGAPAGSGVAVASMVVTIMHPLCRPGVQTEADHHPAP